jgi:fused signal recognition particle receptor
MDPGAGAAPGATTEAPADGTILDDPEVIAGGAGVGVLLVFVLYMVLGRGRAVEAPPEAPPPVEQRVEKPPVEAPKGIVAQLAEALGRTRAALQDRFDTLFAGPMDESTFDELETTLLSADVGLPTTSRLLEPLRTMAKAGEKDPIVLRQALREEMKKVLGNGDRQLAPAGKPWVILVVGVNGSGKTTTIGKLAAQLHKQGKKVLVAAGDTFRAAAIEQLQVWAERAEADIVAHQEGADPGAVAYDALQAAVARGHDVVVIDTAGRLQTRKPLMEQLTKIRRVIDKVVPGAPHETLLVIDGTMGQNALSQAKLFHEATPLTGVVVTKLDGTAKGGMVLTLSAELGLPVKLIGIGEKVDDLRPFDPEAFVEALT